LPAAMISHPSAGHSRPTAGRAPAGSKRPGPSAAPRSTRRGRGCPFPHGAGSWARATCGVTVDAGKAAQVDGSSRTARRSMKLTFRATAKSRTMSDLPTPGHPKCARDVFAKRAVERFDKVRRGHGLLAFRRWGKKVGLEECRARASTTGAAVAGEVD